MGPRLGYKKNTIIYEGVLQELKERMICKRENYLHLIRPEQHDHTKFILEEGPDFHPHHAISAFIPDYLVGKKIKIKVTTRKTITHKWTKRRKIKTKIISPDLKKPLKTTKICI